MPGGVAPKFGSEKVSRYMGVSQLQLRVSRYTVQLRFRKSVMFIKFPPVILGPEMAARILWAPGIFWFFLLENPHAHKIPPFGGSWFFWKGGVEVPILFLWAWGFFRKVGGAKASHKRAFATPKTSS